MQVFNKRYFDPSDLVCIISFLNVQTSCSRPIVDDMEICMVEINAGRKPLYTEVADKNGVKTNKFFIRRGNSSQELPLVEVADYVANHFS